MYIKRAVLVDKTTELLLKKKKKKMKKKKEKNVNFNNIVLFLAKNIHIIKNMKNN